MSQKTSSRTAGSFGLRLWKSPWPTVGWEISQFGIGVARWLVGSGEFEGISWKPVPPGAVEASPLRENFLQPEEVNKALAAALAPLGLPASNGSSPLRDVVLVIPDQAARLFVLQFDAFPRQPAEALALVKWRLKKSVPFDIDSAAVSFFAQPAGGQWDVTAVATSRAVIRQYEALAENFGLRPRWVTLSTLASLELLRGTGSKERGSQGPSGVLVAKYSPPWLTIAILQGESLRLFRTVPLPASADGTVSPTEALEALYPSVAYFQDSFQSPLETAYLCGLGETGAVVAESLERELQLRVQPLLEGLEREGDNLDPHQREWHFAALYGMVQGQARR